MPFPLKNDFPNVLALLRGGDLTITKYQLITANQITTRYTS